MGNNIGSIKDTVFFVSDAHFGRDADENERIRLFVELLAEIRECGAALFIVGDLFDFWIEYRSVIRSDYFLVLHALRGLVESGVEVRYLVGNHDFALGKFLEEAVGISIHSGCIDTTLHGKRIHISHGDKIGKGGVYKAIYKMLRNRFFQALYKLIHPNIGVKIGEFCSTMSNKRPNNPNITQKYLEKYRKAAQVRFISGENDMVIFAHTHHAELLSIGGGEYCNIGSWIDNYDYAMLRDGKIQLRKWGISAS